MKAECSDSGVAEFESVEFENLTKDKEALEYVASGSFGGWKA